MNHRPSPPPLHHMGGYPPQQNWSGYPQDQYSAMGYYNPAVNTGYYGGQFVPQHQFNYGLTDPASLFHPGRVYNQPGSSGWDQQQPSSSGMNQTSHDFTSDFGHGQESQE